MAGWASRKNSATERPLIDLNVQIPSAFLTIKSSAVNFIIKGVDHMNVLSNKSGNTFKNGCTKKDLI